MPVDKLHRKVASVALRAAARHGFALGGGNALIAYGVVNRPTEDVDLFTDRENGVRAAAAGVEAALEAAGYRAERQDKTSGLPDVFYGMGDGLAEWVITAPGGDRVGLQMAYFRRSRKPSRMSVGPVVDLEDALGGKVSALATRISETDYFDVAAALGRYAPDQLMHFALRVDPGLTRHDFADAGRRLDRFSDRRLIGAGLSPEAVVLIRERFASWPRR